MPNTLPTATFLTLLILFQFKHLVADFFLQTTCMATGKERVSGWLAPLAAHVAVHAGVTGLIFAVWAPAYLGMAGVDFVIHFAVDRAKGVAGRALDADPSKTVFWWLIGVDQTLHHLTHLGFATLIAAATA